MDKNAALRTAPTAEQTSNQSEELPKSDVETLFEYLKQRDSCKFIAFASERRDELDLEVHNDLGESLLFCASKNGCHRAVQFLVDRGVNLESRDGYNFTPLHQAAIWGHFRCAKILLDAGASSQTRDDLYNSSPLVCAVYWGFTNIVQLLCMAEDSVTGQSARYGYGPLTLAAFKGFTEAAHILLRHKANVEERNTSGTTPLMAACSQGSMSMVKLLLKHGASVNRKNNMGETPLIAACSCGNADVVTHLLQNGASPRKTSEDGETPLHVACIRGHVNVAEILLKHGIDVNKTGPYARTALHYAALRDNEALINLLMAFDANIEMRDVHGYTAMELQGSSKSRCSDKKSSPRSPRNPLTPPVVRRHCQLRQQTRDKRLTQSVDDLRKQFIPAEQANSVATINKFMRMCHKQFPLVRGMEQIRFRNEIFAAQAPGFLQILSKDVAQSQWILISTLECSGAIVRVYDPLLRDPHSYETKCKIASQIRYTTVDRGHLVVQVMSVKQGATNHDTGPLVIAMATDMLHNKDATGVMYSDTIALRRHMKDCFRNKKMTPFPRQTVTSRTGSTNTTRRFPTPINTPNTHNARFMVSNSQRLNALQQRMCRTSTPVVNSIQAWYKLELYCICHMPYDNDMVACNGCDRFFHPSCLYGNIFIPEDSHGSRYLQCFDCSPIRHRHLISIHQPNLNNDTLKYDLFVAYSYSDMRFVRDTFITQLDRTDGRGQYDLMICDRDWPVGGPVIDTIVEKMEQSVKAVAIISRGFLHGAYTHYEWNMMVHCKPYASAVILLDSPDSLELTGYLRTLLASRMYLEWSDDAAKQQVFWQKLTRFLGKPLHRMRQEMNQETRQENSHETRL